MLLKKLTLSQINAMPTIEEGHTEDLKYESKSIRIWLSRMKKEDGMPYDNQVIVEKAIKGQWETIDQYQAK